MTDAFAAYRTSVLFLLVGTNPLPDYVAAMLLAKDHATVYLLYTASDLENGRAGTGEVAGRIRDLLGQKDQRPSLNVIPLPVDDSRGQVIEQQVQQILGEMESRPGPGDLGLNYTGGTKPMAVHAAHVLRAAYPAGCYSYLDPRSLSMLVRHGEHAPGPISIGRSVPLKLKDLLALHGYHQQSKDIRPIPPALCLALARVHSAVEGHQKWSEWMSTLAESSPQLPPLCPELQPVNEALAALCPDQTPTPEWLAGCLGYDRLSSCSKALRGEWLEQYTFDQLRTVSEELKLTDLGAAFEAEWKPASGAERDKGMLKMELDVAATYGYQLYALSCIATCVREKAKEHLLETFVRARQLGGDEARLALVCCHDSPRSLQNEVQRNWDAAGKIRVFGRADLLSLAERLKEWVREANKEVS